jgi:peptidyl-prolyl cis-trans isomerase C
MIRFKPLLAALVVAALAACTQKGGTDDKDIVATVDGKGISRNTYEEYVKGVASKPSVDLTAEQRDTLLTNLIRGQVIAEGAEKDGSAALNETRAALDLGRYQILQKASMDAYLKDRKPSEEELRAEFDLQLTTLDKVQYRTAHIQLPTEEAAKAVLAQLKGGANFAQLAKQSTDTNTRDKGGELDWAGVSNMPEAYAAAVLTLKKGETAAAPVKTQYGYHVVRVLDSREAPMPTYEQARERLVQIVEQKKWKAYVDGLVAKAKVEKKL